MKRILSLVLVLVLACSCWPAAFAAEKALSYNPLIQPQKLKTLSPPQRYTNILLLGIDFGFRNYRGSGSKFKKTLEDCHTDAIMVASINMTTSEVNLISLPRDTVTYVPGVRGIYKLNGAFNCAETVEEGFERISDAASWLLGGIQIDHYCAVDMAAMIALGDFIGGVDMELEMNYTGHSGKKYYRGLQHLDGTGITDYLRARVNATVNGNDIGRTNRQRETMKAIFNKIRSNAGLIKSGWDYANSGEINFFTDMTLGKVLNLLNKVQASDDIGSYVLTGKYRGALNGWNFTFTDQANRIDVIKTVYDVEVPEIPYVSYEYADWLMKSGFETAYYIAVAGQILDHAHAQTELTAEQQTAVDELQAAYEYTIRSFEAGADDIHGDEAAKLVYRRQDLKKVANQAVQLLNYNNGQVSWYVSEYWYKDPIFNEYQFSWQ